MIIIFFSAFGNNSYSVPMRGDVSLEWREIPIAFSLTPLWGHCDFFGTEYYYRPQTKFAKVMFLQVSVCPQGGGGMHGCSGGGGMCGCSRGACMGYDEMWRYGQWAGSTHPTGMHSCFFWVFLLLSIVLKDSWSSPNERNLLDHERKLTVKFSKKSHFNLKSSR